MIVFNGGFHFRPYTYVNVMYVPCVYCIIIIDNYLHMFIFYIGDNS